MAGVWGCLQDLRPIILTNVSSRKYFTLPQILSFVDKQGEDNMPREIESNYKQIKSDILNIDLHNVLGFYNFLVALLLTYIEIYYSFQCCLEMPDSLLDESGVTIRNELSPKGILKGNLSASNFIMGAHTERR